MRRCSNRQTKVKRLFFSVLNKRYFGLMWLYNSSTCGEEKVFYMCILFDTLELIESLNYLFKTWKQFEIASQQQHTHKP